jgi:hypothetical protein
MVTTGREHDRKHRKFYWTVLSSTDLDSQCTFPQTPTEKQGEAELLLTRGQRVT